MDLIVYIVREKKKEGASQEDRRDLKRNFIRGNFIEKKKKKKKKNETQGCRWGTPRYLVSGERGVSW